MLSIVATRQNHNTITNIIKLSMVLKSPAISDHNDNNSQAVHVNKLCPFLFQSESEPGRKDEFFNLDFGSLLILESIFKITKSCFRRLKWLEGFIKYTVLYSVLT